MKRNNKFFSMLYVVPCFLLPADPGDDDLFL